MKIDIKLVLSIWINIISISTFSYLLKLSELVVVEPKSCTMFSRNTKKNMHIGRHFKLRPSHNSDNWFEDWKTSVKAQLEQMHMFNLQFSFLSLATGTYIRMITWARGHLITQLHKVIRLDKWKPITHDEHRIILSELFKCSEKKVDRNQIGHRNFNFDPSFHEAKRSFRVQLI